MRLSPFASRAIPLLALLAHCGHTAMPCGDGAACPTDATMPADAPVLDAGALGAPCTLDIQCASGVCLTGGRCTAPCTQRTDCPSGSNWMCAGVPSRGTVCVCAPSGQEVACNGVDEDCDGVTDPHQATCNGACTDLWSSDTNCGGCGTLCAGASVCSGGACVCPPTRPTTCGTMCVDTMADPAHCGGCATACPNAPNAVAACVAGVCGATCNAGLGDCDGNAANGCETNVQTSTTDCGACGHACSFAHAGASCAGGTCVAGACAAGYSDCDGDPATGCEAMTASDASHCGACGHACATAHTSSACAAGACVVTACAAGFADCDHAAANGCEVGLQTDALNCAACGHACPGATAANTIASCAAGACGLACAAGYGDCDGTTSNGCETATSRSLANCGACGHACTAGQSCVAGACRALRFTGATAATWEMSTGSSVTGEPGYTDYAPAGATSFYAVSSSGFSGFDTAGATWTVLTAPTPALGGTATFAGPAWIGTHLYLIDDGRVDRYDLTAATWSTLLTGTTMVASSQNAHDDAGHVYALTADDRIATFDTATNTISYQAFGMVPPVIFSRLAWDSLSHLLFIEPNLNVTNLYSFDPATGAIHALTPLPGASISPIFCSDRSGHLYATEDDRDGAVVWQYQIATDTWTMIPPMPFPHGQNGACTVTDSGYLYITDTGPDLARIGLM